MKKQLIIGSAVAIALASTSAFAAGPVQGGYIGANYIAATFEEDDFVEDVDLDILSFKAGAKVNPYVAFEARAGFGIGDDSATFGSVTASIEADYLLGAYGVFGIPNESPVYPYAVLGYSKGELTLKATGPGGSASASASESDISYGIGANLTITEKVDLNAEYMQFIDKDGAEISGLTVGAVYRF